MRVIIKWCHEQHDCHRCIHLGQCAGLHGSVGEGIAMGHLGHDEAMEAEGREFDPRPGHYIVG